MKMTFAHNIFLNTLVLSSLITFSESAIPFVPKCIRNLEEGDENVSKSGDENVSRRLCNTGKRWLEGDVKLSTPDSIAVDHFECLNEVYAMRLFIEEAHLSFLAVPTGDDDAPVCPSIIMHSVLEGDMEQVKAMFIVSHDYVVEQFASEEMNFHLGAYPLESIMDAYTEANAGWNGATTYHPITSNCAALIRNMMKILGIPLKEDQALVQFITDRLMAESADEMIEVVRKTSDDGSIYDDVNHFVNTMGGSAMKETIVKNLIQLYM